MYHRLSILGITISIASGIIAILWSNAGIKTQIIVFLIGSIIGAIVSLIGEHGEKLETLKKDEKLFQLEQYIPLKTKFDRIVREFRVESIYYDIDQNRTVKNPEWKLKLHKEFTDEELQILIDKGNIDDSDILIMVK